MKAFLMYPDRDFDTKQPLPWNERVLTQDLGLDTLFQAMANGDEFLFEIAGKAVFFGLQSDVDTILYRQQVVKDSLKNPEVIRELYTLMVDQIARARKGWWGLSHSPDSLLYSSVLLIESSLGTLRKLRTIAEESGSHFSSEALSSLFLLFRQELDEEYLISLQSHLTELKFRKGTLFSAELGQGNEAVNFILRQSQEEGVNWFERILGKGPTAYTFRIDDRDETGAQILSDMRHQGISRVAVALAEAADHVLNFFKMLRTELAFYVGCINLYDRLVAKNEPICFPVAAIIGERRRSLVGLYDVGLSLHMENRLVGNAVAADGKSLIIITGANQGGKSSFLRGIGLAQLMMQCGMFVAAEAFTAQICPAIFTHYKREEDATMKSGKFDEELCRMSEIVDRIGSNAMLLFNESFAATNEREGSEIARQIVSALLDRQIEVLYVTHLYEFAHDFFVRKREDTLFLRAERSVDGSRSFRLFEGEPLETAFGEDLYRQVFDSNVQTA
jgi:hypothetical protein